MLAAIAGACGWRFFELKDRPPRVDPQSTMVGALVFLVAGLGMVSCNGPLARRIATFNLAWAGRIRSEWIRRWFFWPYYRPSFVSYARVGLVAMGLLWTLAAIVIFALIASGVRVID